MFLRGLPSIQAKTRHCDWLLPSCLVSNSTSARDRGADLGVAIVVDDRRDLADRAAGRLVVGVPFGEGRELLAGRRPCRRRRHRP